MQLPNEKGEAGKLSYMCFNFSYVVWLIETRWVWKPQRKKTKTLNTSVNTTIATANQNF
jgi:hypothetical protein